MIFINAILQGVFEWIYGLFLNCISYTANALLGVMSTDLTFFETYAPIVIDLYDIFTAVGWALLLGNLVFQALKGMLAGLGFEAENPASLLARSGIYGFLLLGSKQICELGLSLGGKVIDLMGVPANITLTTPDDSLFTAVGDASWVLVVIIGTVLGFQLIKLFFEIGERYVIVCVLTLLAPLGFAMGGSKATKDIASGYIRMFASMVLMMILNVLFLKLVLNVLSTMPTATTVIPWCVLVVALARTARKVDNLIARIGLNPAITGDPLTHKGGAMALMMLAARSAVKGSVAKAKGSKSGTPISKSAGAKSSSMGANKPSYNTNNQQSSSSSQNQSQTSADNGASQTSNNSTQNAGGNQNTRQSSTNAFGSHSSQRNTANNNSKNNQTSNSSGKNSQTVNNAGQNLNSTVSGGNNTQQMNSQQKSNSSVNNKTSQGGNGMGNKGASPTQVNTNRFGNNNVSAKNSNTTGVNTNAANMSNSVNGQTNNMVSRMSAPTLQKSTQSNNMAMSQKNTNTPQSTINSGAAQNSASSQNNAQPQGGNVKAQNIADRLKAKTNNPAAANNGKNNSSSNLNKNTAAAVNNGKNSMSANQGKNAQSSANQGKNNTPSNPIKNTGATVNNGKNSTVQAASPIKTQQSAVSNGKNNAAPVFNQSVGKTEPPPEPSANSEVDENG